MKSMKIGATEFLTETKTYYLWESAGLALKEAKLSQDQITQLFSTIEKNITAAGANRTVLGKTKDAATAVNKAWEDLKSKVSNSTPIKNVDAVYDQVAEKLKQATGGDQGVMKYVQKYRDFAKKHPIAQSFIYAALIAAVGISSAGVGGAAALGLFKMVDKMLQGEKFSSAVYSGVKTGALTFAASKFGDLLKGVKPGGKIPISTDQSDWPDSLKLDYNKYDYYVSPDPDSNQVIAVVKGTGSPWDPSSKAYAAIHRAAEANKGAFTPIKETNLRTTHVDLKESQIFSIFYTVSSVQMLAEGEGWNKFKSGIAQALGGIVTGAKTIGHNLTTKITADKLMKSWREAGSPTDSKQIAVILVNSGVDPQIVNATFKQLKISKTRTPSSRKAKIQ